MGRRTTTDDTVLIAEAGSYGGLFGLGAAALAALVGWLLVRAGRRRHAR